MSLRSRQSEFVIAVSKLIQFVSLIKGYEFTFGDAYAIDGHQDNSKHYMRLAIDFNLFINGVYQVTTEAHLPLGRYWESLGGIWGGRFKNKDGNHYEWPMK